MLDKFVVVDLETSGLDANGDRIIEIGAIKFSNGKIKGELSSIINYDGTLSEGTLEKTGLKLEDLKDGLDEIMALRMLNVFIGDWTVVAHNAIFELAFLQNNFTRALNKSFTNNFVDTLTVVRDKYTFPHKLEDMCEMLDIWPDTKHRALNDCYFCGRLALELDKKIGLEKWINKIGYTQKHGKPVWSPDYTELVEQTILFGPERLYHID